VARIANVHQQGLSDQAHKNCHDILYKKRQLLDFTDRDKDLIMIKIKNRHFLSLANQPIIVRNDLKY